MHFTTSVPIADGRILLPMQVEGIKRESLASALAGHRLLSISVPRSQSLEKAWYAQAKLSSGRILELSGSSTETENWAEYGTINVTVSGASIEVDAALSVFCVEGFVVDSIQLLVMDEGRYHIEAGLIIKAADDRVLIVVAGEIPGAFSLKLPDGQDGLDPQFPWQRYGTEPVY